MTRGYRVSRLRTDDRCRSGLLAIIAAGIRRVWLPDPAADAFSYVALWVVTATISVALVGAEMVARSRRIHSGLADEMIHAATEQFIPAGVAGALLTFVLFRFAPESLWMLPGLWQVIFSLGFLASCRSLPRPMYAVGVWYLAAGLTCLAVRRRRALHCRPGPWQYRSASANF